MTLALTVFIWLLVIGLAVSLGIFLVFVAASLRFAVRRR